METVLHHNTQDATASKTLNIPKLEPNCTYSTMDHQAAPKDRRNGFGAWCASLTSSSGHFGHLRCPWVLDPPIRHDLRVGAEDFSCCLCKTSKFVVDGVCESKIWNILYLSVKLKNRLSHLRLCSLLVPCPGLPKFFGWCVASSIEWP